MFIVKTSPRAFLYALLPLLIVQGMLFCNGLAGSQASPPLFEMPTPDRALALLALRISLDAAALVAGHFIARDFGWGSRAVYAVFGGLASAAGYAVALRYGLVWVPPIPRHPDHRRHPADPGRHGGGLCVQPACRLRAPQAAAGRAGRQRFGCSTDAAAASPQPDAAPAPAAFEGPVQVRTSLGAMFMAAMVPALLVAALFFTLAPSDPAMAMAVPAQMFVMTAIVTTIPALIGSCAGARAGARPAPHPRVRIRRPRRAVRACARAGADPVRRLAGVSVHRRGRGLPDAAADGVRRHHDGGVPPFRRARAALAARTSAGARGRSAGAGGPSEPPQPRRGAQRLTTEAAAHSCELRVRHTSRLA